MSCFLPFKNALTNCKKMLYLTDNEPKTYETTS